MDKHNSYNILHYSNLNKTHDTSSFLVAELFAMVYGLDVASTIYLTLNEMIGHIISLRIYTDSQSLYNCIKKISRTKEKRLLVDLHMLRQAYECRALTEVL